MHDTIILVSGVALGALVGTIYWLRVIVEAHSRLGVLRRDFERLKAKQASSAEFWAAVGNDTRKQS